jgi:hypothetical protein
LARIERRAVIIERGSQRIVTRRSPDHRIQR